VSRSIVIAGASKGIGTDAGGASALSPNRSRADLCRTHTAFSKEKMSTTISS
jgi:hypothetical protein